MNIAICLSGTVRLTKNSLHSIDLIKNRGHNVKIFIHTWKFECSKSLELHSPGWEEPELIEKLQQLYNPELLDINKYEDHIPLLKTFQSQLPITLNSRSVYSMWYSIFKSNQLKTQYEKCNNMVFDLVYRIRFDSNIIDNEHFSVPVNNYNTLYIPSGYDWGGINDQFAYGSSQYMDIYSNIINNLNLCGTMPYNTETILFNYLKSCNIVATRTRLLVRIHNR